MKNSEVLKKLIDSFEKVQKEVYSGASVDVERVRTWGEVAFAVDGLRRALSLVEKGVVPDEQIQP